MTKENTPQENQNETPREWVVTVSPPNGDPPHSLVVDAPTGMEARRVGWLYAIRGTTEVEPEDHPEEWMIENDTEATPREDMWHPQKEEREAATTQPPMPPVFGLWHTTKKWWLTRGDDTPATFGTPEEARDTLPEWDLDDESLVRVVKLTPDEG